jgi:hypothetical protein
VPTPVNALRRRDVSPARAMLESSLRTAISMGVGAGLTLIVTWLAAKGIDIKVSEEAEFVIGGLIWSALTVAYSALQRRWWPIQTDAPGAARTDLPPVPTPTSERLPRAQ